MGVTEIQCSFRLVLQGKAGKEIPDSSRLDFLEKFLANNFALSDPEDTSTSLNREGWANLPLLAIHQKCQESSFWEMKDSFVLLAYASLVASRPLLQCLLARLNFTLDSEDLSFQYKWKSDFYELCQQHKQQKIMEVSEAWLDTYDEGYQHQFQPKPIHKIH